MHTYHCWGLKLIISPRIIHLNSQIVTPMTPFSSCIYIFNIGLYSGRIWVFLVILGHIRLFWIKLVTCSNKIVDKTTCVNYLILSFDWVVCMTPKDCKSGLQYTKCPLYNIPRLSMLQVEAFFVILWCICSPAKFLQMVSNTSKGS